ncbi:MAG: hypothetical protein JWM27_4956 [Gemmatimonadetes bacterium]|nr:hypothetical protein [Gemmatimonadota bacterium]
MPVLAAAALLALSACASSGLAPSGSTRQVTVRSGDMKNSTAWTFAVTPEDRVVPTVVPLSADSAWTAAQRAYVSLGLAVTRLDAAHRVIGSRPALAGHRLLGEPLSAFVDCGVNAARAPIVTVYTVTLAVTTQVVPVGGTSRVETLVQARAQDPVHNNPAVTCSSSGRLEARIAAQVAPRG